MSLYLFGHLKLSSGFFLSYNIIKSIPRFYQQNKLSNTWWIQLQK